MSTIGSTLSTGLQDLSSAGLLSPALTTQQLQNSSSADLDKLAIATANENGLSSLLGWGASSSSTDTVSNSLATLIEDSSSSTAGNASSTLQALDAALTQTASNPAGITDNAQIGNLFSYLG